MNSVCNGLDVVIRQDHPGAGFHMRCKDNGGRFLRNPGNHILDRRGRKGGCRVVPSPPGLHNGLTGGQAAGFENLAPAVGEPAVADHHDFLVASELAGHGFHRIGAPARHKRHGIRIVGGFEHLRDVPHHLAKSGGHVVERPVREHDRKFEQAVRVNIGQ